MTGSQKRETIYGAPGRPLVLFAFWFLYLLRFFFFFNTFKNMNLLNDYLDLSLVILFFFF